MNTPKNAPTPQPVSTPRSNRLLRTLVIAVALVAYGAAMGFCDEPTAIEQRHATTIKNAWVSDWAEAVKMSKETGKPIMLQFTGSDWCMWCQRLEQDVLNQPAFAKWSDRVIKFRVDFPSTYQLPEREQAQNNVLKEWYGDFVKSYPTCLFVQPNGRVIGTLGYVDGGAKSWINRAEGVLLNMGDLHASLDSGRVLR